MELNVTKPQNKITEYQEKHKTQQDGIEQEDLVKKEKAKQKHEKDKQTLKNIAEKAGGLVKTGATVVSAIPHAVTLAIGAGAGTLIPKILEELNKQKGNK